MSALGSWAGDLFRRIAVPRLPGSESLKDVEAAIAERLTALGYEVTLERFVASDRGIVAASVAGAGCGWVALMVFPLLIVSVPGWPVTLFGFGALILVALVVVGLLQGSIVIGTKEVPATNVVAVRGEPRLWLVAHSDSKAQSLNMASRVIAVTLLGIGLMWVGCLLVARLGSAVPWWVALPGTLAAVVGGGALSRGGATNDSPGAVDNATGVIAALVAAEALAARDDIGVLVTGAEEYGMAGARAWASGGRQGSFVNFDGVDSRGRYRVMQHRAAASTGVTRDTIGGAIAGALGAEIRGLPPGVLVDGVVLARAGMAGVTVSRGDWRTLLVVHTRRDEPGRVDVSAAVQAGRAAAVGATSFLG